jgi:hypothetical protein
VSRTRGGEVVVRNFNLTFQVGRILVCFAGAFKSPTDASLIRHSTDSFLDSSINSTAGPTPSEYDFQFEALLELKEDDGKKTWPVCPQERNCFKIRRGRQRKILLVLRQTGGTRPLPVMKWVCGATTLNFRL